MRLRARRTRSELSRALSPGLLAVIGASAIVPTSILHRATCVAPYSAMWRGTLCVCNIYVLYVREKVGSGGEGG